MSEYMIEQISNVGFWFLSLTLCMRQSRNLDNAELPRPTAGGESQQKNINLFIRAYLGNHAL